jgi:nitrate reductase beta subunit
MKNTLFNCIALKSNKEKYLYNVSNFEKILSNFCNAFSTYEKNFLLPNVSVERITRSYLANMLTADISKLTLLKNKLTYLMNKLDDRIPRKKM